MLNGIALYNYSYRYTVTYNHVIAGCYIEVSTDEFLSPVASKDGMSPHPKGSSTSDSSIQDAEISTTDEKNY